ncbi:efflux RND transporter permease subunit [Rhodopila globiformis]|uniref:CusA/CzcA family heavy metal efflux RND transporter n=1 Tax=Rhodopila globiformis TaxID=1071 RepID=A0A2S6NL63_RHOGL|nr:CusA/CzcA family heavy metal efflux RND transporter [Rhodopila globiformis]PPQ35915.1 CusA/CzcA family heavy metal efflux RND transporter [Rhodopila globiformis]
MQRFFAALVGRRWLVLVLALAMIVAGWFNLQQLAIDAVPDISPKQVLVLTEARGLGPLEVERLVTFPIETQMVGLPLLKNIRSKSRFGISAVYLTFRDSADVQIARAEVAERLPQAKALMPPGVGTPQEGPFATGLGEILEFRLRGPGYTQMQLYQLLKWKLVPQIQLVPGIVNVDIYGGKLQTFQVEVSPQRMEAEGVTLPALFHAIESNNETRGGAYIERGDEQEIVRGLALAESKADIAAIEIRTTPDGVPITVGDVADVRMAPQVQIGAVTHDGEGQTIVGVAEMQYGLNTSDVLPRVKAKLADLRSQLPPGVKIDTFYDRSQLIQRSIHTVAHNLIEGALLVIVILLVMLGSFRAGLIVAAVIPLSMMIAFAGMRAFGIPGNLLSLGAIDFGLVVDGAVVMVENVLRQQSATREKDQADPPKIVPKAAAEVARPVIFSVVIILIVYLPVLSLQDVEGKEFHPMALTVMMALTGALAMTMVVIPALAATFLSATPADRDALAVRWARKAYTPVLRRATDHPWITFGIAGALFAGAVFLAGQLGGEFIPTLQEGAIVVTSNKLPSINLTASLRTVTQIEEVIRSFPDVETVVSQTGSAAVPTDPMGVQSTDSYVILKPPDQWTTAPTQQGIRAAMEKKLKAAIPGVNWEFSQPIRMRMDDLLQGARTPVVLSIFGPDIGELRSLGNKAAQILQSIKGAADVQPEYPGVLPAVTIAIDRQRLARYGISAADALSVVRAIGDATVGTVYGQNDEQTPIQVRLAPDARQNVPEIAALPVGLWNGAPVALSDVAKIGISAGPPQVLRDQLKREQIIDINVQGRDVNSFVTEAQRKVPKELHLPSGYSLQWSGQFQNLRSASARLMLVVPMAMAVIFLLLYLNFNSLRQAALIFLNVPMAATGGIVALTVRGMPFSVTAAIGFISVFGVAILDGVVLVSYINEERDTGNQGRDAAREAAEKRLRPVLTTALVASIGFVPMAVSTSVGAAVQRPLATVVIGGLITATLLTLLVLPAMYPVVGEMRMPDTGRMWRRSRRVMSGWIGRP